MHPLEKFKYCPMCGSSHFVENSFKSKRCESCGFELFMNASASCAAFILNKKGELLVETRKFDPAKGMCDLPGGFCDIDETMEQALHREIKEETNLDIVKADYLFSIPNSYLYSGIAVKTLDFFFVCQVSNEEEMRANDDAKDCQWMKLSDIRTEQFGLRSIRHAMQEFLQKNLK